MDNWIQILLFINAAIGALDLTLIAFAMGKNMSIFVINGYKGLLLAVVGIVACFIPILNLLILLLVFIIISLMDMMQKERERIMREHSLKDCS